MSSQNSPSSTAEEADTIAALATPAGRGGVGIVRISGACARRIGATMLGLRNGAALRAQHIHYGAFYAHPEAPPHTAREPHDPPADQGTTTHTHPASATNDGSGEADTSSGQNNTKTEASGAAAAEIVDRGIALFFPAPHSLTGEDVVELQGHGSPVVMRRLLREAHRLGARSAQPGEFSKRAFLNGKIDLTQAEAIADLIDSSSEQAARGAMRTLEGEFSRRIRQLEERLTDLRSYLEAAMEFPDEALETLDRGAVEPRLQELLQQLDTLLAEARGGALLREGWQVAIAGPPNAGKSSLLNRLSGRDSAIITAEAGATRDLIHEHCLLDGIAMHFTDTAGLRDHKHAPSEAERIGMQRAVQTIEQADHILLMLDSTTHKPPRDAAQLPAALQPWLSKPRPGQTRTVVYNKIDLSGLPPGCPPPTAAQTTAPTTPAADQITTTTAPVTAQTAATTAATVAHISATTGSGLPALRQHLIQCATHAGAGSDAPFLARQRHLEALQRAQRHLKTALTQLHETAPGELLAEEARLAHNELGSITGATTNEQLLDKIFSTFCIGK